VRVERKAIGADESWQVEYLLPFERIHHVRRSSLRWLRKQGANPRMKTAAKPETAIDKGMQAGTAEYIVTSKVLRLPAVVYRLETSFSDRLRDLSRHAVVWCGRCGRSGRAAVCADAERMRASHVVATDDTIMPMLSKGKTANARIGSMWRRSHPYNIFDFTLHRVVMDRNTS